MKAKQRTLGVLLFLILLAGGMFALLTLLLRPQMEPFRWRKFRAMT